MPQPKTVAEKIQDKIDALETKLTTCTSDECTRLDAALAALKDQQTTIENTNERISKFEESVAAKAKEAVDARMDAFSAKLDELKTAHAAPLPATNPEIPKDAYFTCAECEAPLILGAPKCANKDCAGEIDWKAAFDAVLED